MYIHVVQSPELLLTQILIEQLLLEGAWDTEMVKTHFLFSSMRKMDKKTEWLQFGMARVVRRSLWD